MTSLVKMIYRFELISQIYAHFYVELKKFTTDIAQNEVLEKLFHVTEARAARGFSLSIGHPNCCLMKLKHHRIGQRRRAWKENVRNRSMMPMPSSSFDYLLLSILVHLKFMPIDRSQLFGALIILTPTRGKSSQFKENFDHMLVSCSHDRWNFFINIS